VIEGTLDVRRPRSFLPVAVFLLACGWLLARPEVRGVGHEAAILALGSVTIGAAAILAPVPGGVATRPLPAGLVLAIGGAGVLLAAWVAGPPVPTAASTAAPLMNLLAAVAEEALFRRLAFGWLHARHGVTIAVLGTATAFALIHVPVHGIEALPVDLGAGLLLSWQRAASGSWSVPAATHAVANLLAVIR
jgi:membrane protease YdiL (CAAX protease family)